MKKISILLCSAFVMLGTGCTIDSTIDVEQYNKKVIIGANIGDTSTRTYLGDNYIDAEEKSRYPILWNEGDKIAVNGKVSEGLASEYEGKSNAQFVVADVTTPYNIIYPAEIANLDCTAVTFPAEQTYAENSFASKAAVMAGYVEKGGDLASVKMQAVCAFIKITLHGTKTIKDLTLSANNLEAIAGEFAVDCKEATMAPLTGVGYVKITEITYDAEGKAVVVVAVPAGTYDKGFSIIITTDDGYNLTKTFGKSSGVTIAKNTIININQTIDTDTDKVTITDAATLQAFLTAASAGDYEVWKSANGEVILGADIDLKDKTITPASSFNGVFNGNGYVIKNWKSNGAGLFTTLAKDGIVKNVVIDSSCSCSLAAFTGGNATMLVENNAGTISGCVNYAAMSGSGASQASAGYVGVFAAQSSGKIANCINHGEISITSTGITTRSNNWIGGIAAIYNGAEGTANFVENCVNNGNITLEFTDAKKAPKFGTIGGILGGTTANVSTSFTKYGNVVNCINKGNIYYTFATANTGTYTNIGGVVGYVEANVLDCKNYGNVEYITDKEGTDATATTRPAVGGVAGYAVYSVNNCDNHGRVHVEGTYAAGTAGNASAGGNEAPQFGGVAGGTGNTTKAASDTDGSTFSNNHNYGALDLYANMKSSNKSSFYEGGVVGFTSAPITNCSNDGAITVTSCAKTTNFGGVVGRALSTIVGCTNGGKIAFNLGTDETGNRNVQSYCGGIAGYLGGAKAEDDNISDCQNFGSVTHAAARQNTTFNYVGGIVGSYNKANTMTNCHNHNIVKSAINSSIRIGGLCGAWNGEMENCTNNAEVRMAKGIYTEITNDSKEFTTNYASQIGGLVGYSNASYNNCASLGNIYNESEAKTMTGGIIGGFGSAITDGIPNRCIKNCLVKCAIASATDTYAGFVAGGPGSYLGNIQLGVAETPIKISATTTVNGAGIATEKLEDLETLIGFGNNDFSGHNSDGKEAAVYNVVIVAGGIVLGESL